MTGAADLVLKRKLSPIRAIAMSQDGTHLALARVNKDVELWNTDGTLLAWYSGHKLKIDSLAVSQDGSQVVSVSCRSRTSYKDIESGLKYVELLRLDVKNFGVSVFPPGEYRVPVFIPNGQVLAVQQYGPQFYDLGSDVKVASLELTDAEPGAAIAVSANGRLFASTSVTGQIQIWDFATGKRKSALVGHSKWVDQIAFSDDGRLIGSAAQDDTLRIWDTKSGRELRCVNADCEKIFYFAHLAERDGWMIIDGLHGLRVFGTTAKTDCVVELPNSRSIRAVGSAAKGSKLAIGSADGIVYLWNTSDLLRTKAAQPKAKASGATADQGAPFQKLIRPPERYYLRVTKSRHINIGDLGT